jgi:hypothetical protein
VSSSSLLVLNVDVIISSEIPCDKHYGILQLHAQPAVSSLSSLLQKNNVSFLRLLRSLVEADVLLFPRKSCTPQQKSLSTVFCSKRILYATFMENDHSLTSFWFAF